MPVRKLLTTVLILMGILSLANGVYALRYFFATRQQQQMHVMVRMINNNRTLAQSLAADALRYSEKNSSINPLLVQFGIKTNPIATGPAKRP